MKRILLMALLTTAPAHAAGEWQIGLGFAITATANNDKLQHFGAGMATAGITRKLGGTFWQSCAASFAVGMLKEVADKVGNGTSEINDALATGAGCLWFKMEF